MLEINGTPLPEYSQSDIKELKACADAAGIEITTGYGPIYEHDMGAAGESIESALEWYKRLFHVMEQLDKPVCLAGRYILTGRLITARASTKRKTGKEV